MSSTRTITLKLEQLPRLRHVIMEAVSCKRGGIAELARELEVSRTTLYRLSKAKTERRVNRVLLRCLCRTANVSYRALFAPEINPEDTGLSTIRRWPGLKKLTNAARLIEDADLDVVSAMIYWAIARKFQSSSLVATTHGGRRFNKVAVRENNVMCVATITKQNPKQYMFSIDMSEGETNILTEHSHKVDSGLFDNAGVGDVIKRIMACVKSVNLVAALRSATAA